MKIDIIYIKKLSALIFYCQIINLSNIYAQESPVKFLNNTYTINIDTTKKNPPYSLYDIDLRYKFINTGEHVTFIDDQEYLPYITKPGYSSIIFLHFDNFFKYDVPWTRNKRDTSASLSMLFYFEGQTYNEKLVCNYTFGKSKLIEFDNQTKIVTDSVARFFNTDIRERGKTKDDTTEKNYPTNIVFTVYYLVKNISKKTIWCTKNMLAYGDTDIRDAQKRSGDHANYVAILPNAIYKLPIQMQMASRYSFKKVGLFEVFSDDTIEPYRIDINSNYKPKGKYVY